MASDAGSSDGFGHPGLIDVRLGAPAPIHRIVSWMRVSELRSFIGGNALRLPQRVGDTASVSVSCRVLCVGPAEWLIIGADVGWGAMDTAALIAVELTHGLVRIDLAGVAVEQLLSCLSGVDPAPSSFPPDTCARTRLASVAVVLDRRSTERFACYVSRSYRPYFMEALHEATRGLTAAEPASPSLN